MQETLILTPNRRLSAALLALDQKEKREIETWESPLILPLSTWMESLWKQSTLQNIQDFPLLIKKEIEALLWEKIIKTQTENHPLLQVTETASLARSAFSLLKQWRVPLHHPDFQGTEDSLQFQSWALAFEAQCEKNHWLYSESLIENLIQKIEQDEIQIPEKIELAGFTEISPLLKAFFEVCEKKSCQISKRPAPYSDPDVKRRLLPNEETEITALALWAKTLYEEDPTNRIACVFPHLDRCRETVIRIFSEAFSSPHQVHLDYTALPFNISAGEHLSQYPVIHLALEILKLNPKTIPLDTFSKLLHSPFLGEAETELHPRAILDKTLRNANIHTLAIDKLIDETSQPSFLGNCPLLKKRLEAFALQKNNSDAILPISHWVQYFHDILMALGWPGERSLHSHEYQTIEAWFTLLNEYASLEGLLGSVSEKEALHQLQMLASHRVFQVESPEANIQILGLLEATEIPFDYLWVMGLDDSTWPPSPKPNPFIPHRLQKDLKMPHASATRELLYCQELMEQLKHSAKVVILSSAEKKEGAEQRPSPMIQAIPEVKLFEKSLQTPSRILWQVHEKEWVRDDQGPTLLPKEKERGGSRIFELQAACPFKAFAECRLQAKAIEPLSLGLKAFERGNLIHRILELLWLEIKDHQHLCQMENEALAKRIESITQLVLGEDKQSKQLEKPRYQALESQRLQELIFAWMQLEKQRPPFKIQALETESVYHIRDLNIRLRIDRIDEMETGEKLLIDYKTNLRNSIQSWCGERPDKPQLPLYAMLNKDSISGIAYGQIHPEKMKWEGLSEWPLNIPGIRTIAEVSLTEIQDWQAQVEDWEKNLNQLAESYESGWAAVDPKDETLTCQTCDLQSLCRIHEKSSEDL